MTTHHLKIFPSFFRSVCNGTKTFELRRDDRGYEIGDTLVLSRFPPERETQRLEVRVVYLLRGPCLGLAEDWVILGFVRVPSFAEGSKDGGRGGISDEHLAWLCADMLAFLNEKAAPARPSGVAFDFWARETIGLARHAAAHAIRVEARLADPADVRFLRYETSDPSILLGLARLVADRRALARWLAQCAHDAIVAFLHENDEASL